MIHYLTEDNRVKCGRRYNILLDISEQVSKVTCKRCLNSINRFNHNGTITILQLKSHYEERLAALLKENKILGSQAQTLSQENKEIREELIATKDQLNILIYDQPTKNKADNL